MSQRSQVIEKKSDTKKRTSALKAQNTELFPSTSTPADHIPSLQRSVGNQAVQRLFKDVRGPLSAVSGQIQPEFTIGQPGDVYEQEADRVADAVMKMPQPEVQQQVEEEEEEEILATKPLFGQITPLVQRQVKEVEEEEMLQAKSREDAPCEVSHGLESQINAIKGGGRPLAKSERAYFEPRFGHDFSQVRIHNDAHTADVAKVMNARAFTVWNHIGFAAGEYNPGTIACKKLLAHELVHTLQQHDAAFTSIRRKLLPGGFTTEDVSTTSFDPSAFEQMSDEDLEALYRVISQLYRERDREGESGPEMETLKGNIRTIWAVLAQRDMASRSRLRSWQADIVQAKCKTSSPEGIRGLKAGVVSEQAMRTPERRMVQHDVDPVTLAQIEEENPYRGTRIHEITHAPGLRGSIPLPIPYNQIDPSAVNVVDVWGIECGPCQNVAQQIIWVSQLPEFSSVRFYHLCADRFPALHVSSVPMVFVLLGRNLRFQWDSSRPFTPWLISQLRLPVFRQLRLSDREQVHRDIVERRRSRYSQEELLEYVRFIDTQGRIENRPSSDRKAREIVRHWEVDRSSFALDVRLRRLLIQEMLSRVTSNADERAIISLLQGSTDDELLELLDPRRGLSLQELENNIQGREWRSVLAFIRSRLSGNPELHPIRETREGEVTCSTTESLQLYYAQRWASEMIQRTIDMLNRFLSSPEDDHPAVRNAIGCYFTGASNEQIADIRDVYSDMGRLRVLEHDFFCVHESVYVNEELRHEISCMPGSNYLAQIPYYPGPPIICSPRTYICEIFFDEPAYWQAIRIVHETAHRSSAGVGMNIGDIRYGTGPEFCGALTVDNAIRNADSYALFAASVNRS